MKRSGKILLEGTIEEFKKHCKGADNREYLLINTKEIKKDGTYTIYQLDSNTERVTSISAKGKYGKLPFIPYDKLYLTFTANSKGTFVFLGTLQNSIQYSTDDGVSWSLPLKNLTVNVNRGDKVLWKGNNMYPSTSSPNGGIGYFKGGTASFDVCGNISSLYFGDDFKNNTDLGLYTYTFYKLFSECPVINASNLILGADRVGNMCYANMFENSTSLVKGPLLKGSLRILSSPYFKGPYYGMYSGTNIVPDCSDIDFSNSLTLSCGILVGLFLNTKVTDNDLRNILPINPQTNHYYLPATTLTSNCYLLMFYGCTSLITAPELPATTLLPSCYMSMFEGCTSLTTAPVLPATTLEANLCYKEMFKNCTNLNYISILATSILGSMCLDNWVLGVAVTGTMVVNGIDLPVGNNGIPSGWTVLDIHSLEYLTFIATSDGTFAFSGQTQMGASNCSISYSTNDGETWSEPSMNVTVNVQSGDKVMWKGEMNNGAGGPPDFWGIGKFKGGTARFEVQGNIMSLLYGDNFKNQTSFKDDRGYVFAYLFSETSIISAYNLILPATTLSSLCYQNMFDSCISLTTAPSVLPATTLYDGCYEYMFNDCTSLTTAPELPATTLATSCYYYMFKGCTNLTTAPHLQATTLANNCYNKMFRGCTNLNYIKMLATDISANNCLTDWVYDVAASGTFVKAASMVALPTGASGIPSGWTVEDATQ